MFQRHNIALSLSDTSATKDVKKVLSLLELPRGWHYGEGLPPSIAAAREALQIRQQLTYLGAKQLEFFPRTDGSIIVSAYADEDTVNVAVGGKGVYDLEIDREDEEIAHVRHASIERILSEVVKLGWREQPQSAFFIRYTTPTSKDASTAWLYKRLMTGSQLSTRHVGHWQVAQSANIFPDTIRAGSLASPPSSSDSISRNSQTMNSSKTSQIREMTATT